MKKIIKRFWGVAFTLVLLSTMLIGAIPQASAATLSWGYATLPGDTLGPLQATNFTSIEAPWDAIINGQMQVMSDFAVASDGQTIYACTNFGGYKSTNGGRTWNDLFTSQPIWGGSTSERMQEVDRVAVAPDNPNLVVFLDTTNRQFGLSTAGGYNLHVADVTSGAGTHATAVTDVDVCPQAVIHGQTVNLVLVSGKLSSAAALYYLNYGVDFSGWDECLSSTAFPTFDDHFVGANKAKSFMTVKHSPSFSRDYVAYLVGDNGSTGSTPSMDIASFNSNQFNSGIPSYQYYPDAGVVLDTVASSHLLRADIVFDPAFVAGNEESRFTYIGVSYDDGGYNGGFYRVTDNAGPVVTGNLLADPPFYATAPSVWSIDINADGSMLVAASGYTSATWTITYPKAPSYAIAFTPSRLVKRSGGGHLEGFSGDDYQTIAFASNGVVLARMGTTGYPADSGQGAFALSRDNGYTFNDISMVDMFMADINDQLVNANGVERYVVASNNATFGNTTAVFYWDGTYWERVLTIKNYHPNGYLAGVSPNNFNVLYLANKSTAMIRYTATAGRVNWLERSCPTPFTSALTDLAVQDDTTLWVATTVSTKGCVTKLSETGNIWPLGPPYYNVVFTGASGVVASLTLVSPNNLVAGSTTGYVAYSSGGAFWWGWPFVAQIPGAGSVHATASGLGSGDIIYATDSATSDIYIWVLGSSLAWTSLFYPDNNGMADIGQHGADLQIYNGAMYYLSYNATESWIGRALMPALNTPDSDEWVFNKIQYSGTLPYTQCVASWQPDPLKFSVDASLGYGNKIWITDASGCVYLLGPFAPDQIMCFTDTLVTYTVPILSKDEILVQVNRETGEAYNVTVSWTTIGYKEYEFEVFYDRACTHFYGSDDYYANGTGVLDIVVGPQGGADFHLYYQPGESFYYRVRVETPFYSPWSTVHSLDVQPIRAPIPELYSPANGGTVPYLRPGFSWTPMGFVHGGKYHIQIGTKADFSTASIVVDEIIDASTVDGAGYGLSKDLKDGTQYFWHVQVVEPYPGDWSTVANFWVKLAAGPTPPVTVTQAGPTTVILTQTNPPATSVVVTAPVSENVVNPSYIWAIIIIGAVLVIAVIVLIFRTRRV